MNNNNDNNNNSTSLLEKQPICEKLLLNLMDVHLPHVICYKVIQIILHQIR